MFAVWWELPLSESRRREKRGEKPWKKREGGISIISLIITALGKVAYYVLVYPWRVLYRALKRNKTWMIAHPLAVFSVLFTIALFGPGIYDFLRVIFGEWLILMKYILEWVLLIPEYLWNTLMAVLSYLPTPDNIKAMVTGNLDHMTFDLNGNGHIDTIIPFASQVSDFLKEQAQSLINLGSDPGVVGSGPIMLDQIVHNDLGVSFSFSNQIIDFTILKYFVSGIHSPAVYVAGESPIWGWIPAL